MFIRGKRGRPIAPTDIELTLSYATFKAIPAKTNVNAWFKNRLPIGLIAEIGEVSEGATKATITISGTPQNKWSGATFIYIPTEVLATGNDEEISVYISEGCRIVDPTIYKATVTSGKAQVDGLTKVSIEEGATVTIIANSPATGYAFDKWIVVSGEITLADENASTNTFVMPESNVEIKATYKHAHSYKNFAEKPATCVATGMKEYFKCETCGKLFDADRNETTESALTLEIDPTAHFFGELHPEKPGTCVADGTKEHKDCTLCHKHFASDGTTEITDVTVASDPTAHDFEKEWTKTSDGHYHVCKNDGCPVGRDEIKAHTPDRAAATETEPVKCTVCGYFIAPASVHVHHLTAVPEVGATCIKEGKKSYYACDGCELKFKDESGTEEITDESWLVIPKAHKYGEWIEEVPATAESTGKKAHKDCEFCHKHFDNNGEEIEDLTLYKTYTVYLRWGTLQAGELTSSGTGRAYASIDVREGTVVTIIAQEETGSVFAKWSVSGRVDVTFANENSSTTTFVMPTSDVWLECEYKSVRTVTVENGTGGGEIEVGQTVTITADIAPEGKEFDKWIVVAGDPVASNEIDFMWYLDIEHNGEKYRGIYFTEFRPEISLSRDSGMLGRDPVVTLQYQNHYFGRTLYWFRYDPILWKIIKTEGEKTQLLCMSVLDTQPYCVLAEKSQEMTYTNKEKEQGYYEIFNVTPGVPKGIHATNYRYSNVRKWLNETFYPIAFDEDQKNRINDTYLDNESAGLGENTTDKAFLITYSEALDLGSDNDAIRYASEYAICNGAGVNPYLGDSCDWYLRELYYGKRFSPDAKDSLYRYVGICGVNNYGRRKQSYTSYDPIEYASTRTLDGVVPSVWVTLN